MQTNSQPVPQSADTERTSVDDRTAGASDSNRPAGRHLALVPRRSDEAHVSDFAAELDAAIKSITKGFESNQKSKIALQKLRDELAERGFWSAISAKFGSDTDKEITAQLLALCGNLELAQDVIRVILKIQTEKNHLLKEFNNTLVNKIASIEGDTRTLDGNQRAAAIAFLSELQYQIEDQLQQADLVQAHEQKISDQQQAVTVQGEALSVYGKTLALQSEALNALKERQVMWDKRFEDIDAMRMTIENRISEIDLWRSNKDDQDIELRLQLARSDAEIEKLSQNMRGYKESVDLLAAQRLAERSFKAIIIRNALPLLALVVSVATAYVTTLGA